MYQEDRISDDPRACTGCKTLKPPSEYGNQYGRPCKRCKACNRAKTIAYMATVDVERMRAARRSYYQRHREAILAGHVAKRLGNPEHRREIQRRSLKKWRYEQWQTALLRNCKHSARRRGHECTITLDDIKEMFEKQGGISYWIPIPMTPSPLTRHPFRPSVDRLDNERGYEKSNCVLVCQCINFLRGRRTIDQMAKIVEAIRSANWEKDSKDK